MYWTMVVTLLIAQVLLQLQLWLTLGIVVYQNLEIVFFLKMSVLFFIVIIIVIIVINKCFK